MTTHISTECSKDFHQLCKLLTCECDCHEPYPDTGESGATYDKEMEYAHEND